jgi:hypothetical protein
LIVIGNQSVKAEIIYTAATFTGFGAVVGYLDIQDK